MSRLNLRQKPRISYYEPEEPGLDEYVCAGLGVFTTLTLPRGVRFGPYRGQRYDQPDSTYCWQIYDRNNKPSHVIDAADANKSNWMRYVNCARHWNEQNLVAFQYQGQLYYRTIKIIPRFTELMVFYGSEFANALGINLRRYNSPTGYAQKLGAPVAKKPKLNSKRYEKKIAEEKNVVKPENLTQNIPETAQPQAKAHNKKKKKTNNKNTINVKKLNKCENINVKSVMQKSDTKNDLNNNIERSQFICNDCNVKFHSKEKLVQHIKTHERNIYYSCTECNFKDITRNSLENHMRCHDRKRSYVCKECGYRFKTNALLNRHVRDKHVSKKLFSCDLCDYKCKQKNNLITHIRIHTGEKPYACHLCEYRSAHKNSLTIHMRIHTGEKPYACNLCKFRSANKSHLTYHMGIHTGEKPYACNLCEYRSARKSDLTTHMRIHTGEKPYACHLCEYRSARKSDLTTHMRIHTGEKPYACNLCEYRSARKSNLTIHMRIHTGEKL